MLRYIHAFVTALFVVSLATGCGSMVQWGELGDEVSAGPYRIKPPKKFNRDAKMSSSTAVETKFAFRGPRSRQSEPGIVLSFGRHGTDFSRQAP